MNNPYDNTHNPMCILTRLESTTLTVPGRAKFKLKSSIVVVHIHIFILELLKYKQFQNVSGFPINISSEMPLEWSYFDFVPDPEFTCQLYDNQCLT